MMSRRWRVLSMRCRAAVTAMVLATAAPVSDAQSVTALTGLSFGTILSGAKLVDSMDFRQQLRALEPEAIGGEMEGAGLYVACHDLKVDWILVKAICDFADGQKSRNKANEACPS